MAEQILTPQREGTREEVNKQAEKEELLKDCFKYHLSSITYSVDILKNNEDSILLL